MKADFKKQSKKSGVYRIRCLVDNKVYIGSTKQFKTRKSTHVSTLRKGTHHNKHLQHAFDKYGEDNFVFEVLEVVDGDRLVYTAKEQVYLDRFVDNWDQCYNFSKNAIAQERSTFSKTPEETREKLSKATSGKNNPMYGTTGSLSPNWGKKHSQITKDKIAAAHTGKSTRGKGWKHSEETKAKMRAKHLGKKLSEEHKAKLSKAHKLKSLGDS